MDIWHILKQECDRRADLIELFNPAIAQQLRGCANDLTFIKRDGLTRLVKANVRFCHHRLCPICQWRRSLSLAKRVYESVPFLLEAHPASTWATVALPGPQAVAIESLGDWLDTLNASHALLRRRQCWTFDGWIRFFRWSVVDDQSISLRLDCLGVTLPGQPRSSASTLDSAWKACLHPYGEQVGDPVALNPVAASTPAIASIVKQLSYEFPYDTFECEGSIAEHILKYLRQRRQMAVAGIIRPPFQKAASSPSTATYDNCQFERWQWRSPLRSYDHD